MNEREIEALLGAYALDAVEDDERVTIEAHLAVCPPCRAEVSAHREVAALLANTGVTVPDGVWDKIAHELAPELPAHLAQEGSFIERLTPPTPLRPRSGRVARWATLGVAAALVAIALLSFQVVHLDQEVHPTPSGPTGIAAAVDSVLAGPHRSFVLTARNNARATVIESPAGDAYFIGSTLPALAATRTYQLWTVGANDAVVSLGVLGPDPKVATGFRLQSAMHRLMITVEPAGGTAQPTSPVLLSATI